MKKFDFWTKNLFDLLILNNRNFSVLIGWPKMIDCSISTYGTLIVWILGTSLDIK